MDGLNIQTKVDPADIAKEMAHQFADEDVLAFLGDLDEAMASWDFTQKAAELFVLALVEERKEMGKGWPMATGDEGALRRVTEFLRQLKINPSVQRDERFYTVWTDPQASSAHLTVSDLEMLVQLAAISVTKEDE